MCVCEGLSKFNWFAMIDNLDHELAAFLKKWFPDEVKTKQRYNELMAGVDQYGEVYATQKCVVM
jgi:E3 ubiquitin-protein ligase BAH